MCQMSHEPILLNVLVHLEGQERRSEANVDSAQRNTNVQRAWALSSEVPLEYKSGTRETYHYYFRDLTQHSIH